MLLLPGLHGCAKVAVDVLGDVSMGACRRTFRQHVQQYAVGDAIVDRRACEAAVYPDERLADFLTIFGDFKGGCHWAS